MRELEAVSLFSNCGAGDLGFREAGFRFRVMAELCEGRLSVALLNHPGAEGVPGDLRSTWPAVVRAWRGVSSGPPVLLAACPPCQGMSTARSARGKEDKPEHGARDKRNLLVVPIANVAKALKPTYIVVENVPAFLRRKVPHPVTGTGISAARLLMAQLGDEYRVYPLLTNLADYGVPQSRKRAFLTFVRSDSVPGLALAESDATTFPIPTHAEDHGGSPRTLGEALTGLALEELDALNEERSRSKTEPLHFVPVWNRRQYEMVAAIPAGSGASAWETQQCPECGPVNVGPEDATCDCGSPLLRPVVETDEGYRLVRGFRRSSYRRLDPQVPCATITTASGRVGSSRTLHPTENRVLSPLECARLQTLPYGFDWGDSLEEHGVDELRAMIGEAVPPLFTKAHGQVLAALRAGRKTPDRLSREDARCRTAWRKLGGSST